MESEVERVSGISGEVHFLSKSSGRFSKNLYMREVSRRVVLGNSYEKEWKVNESALSRDWREELERGSLKRHGGQQS